MSRKEPLLVTTVLPCKISLPLTEAQIKVSMPMRVSCFSEIVEEAAEDPMSSVLPVINQDSERKRRTISTNWNDRRRRRCQVAYSVSRVIERHAVLCTVNIAIWYCNEIPFACFQPRKFVPADFSWYERVFFSKIKKNLHKQWILNRKLDYEFFRNYRRINCWILWEKINC